MIFCDNDYLFKIIDCIVFKVGWWVDEICLMVDVCLLDGLCVNVIIFFLVFDGVVVFICCFGSNLLKFEDLFNYKVFIFEMVMLLEGVMKVCFNIIILGGIGLGKMMLLNMFLSFIFNSDWIVIIEDVVEL